MQIVMPVRQKREEAKEEGEDEPSRDTEGDRECCAIWQHKGGFALYSNVATQGGNAVVTQCGNTEGDCCCEAMWQHRGDFCCAAMPQHRGACR